MATYVLVHGASRNYGQPPSLRPSTASAASASTPISRPQSGCSFSITTAADAALNGPNPVAIRAKAHCLLGTASSSLVAAALVIVC
jgi:hypothetical protein